MTKAPSTNDQVSSILFAVLWLLIVGISVHDGLLAWSNRQVLADFELNPVGRQLIAWNGGAPWLLLAAKGAGTVAAAALLLLLFSMRRRLALAIAAAIAAFQAALLAFLYFA